MSRAYHTRRSTTLLITFFFLASFAGPDRCRAQQEKRSPAFKSYRAPTTPPLVMPSSLDAQLLESFALLREANAGNAPAEHELGLRYLLGRGFPADTAKAYFWIAKAARQHLPIAEFNLGIFTLNAWGTEWDPFAAFRQFREAAKEEMPEALYVLGLMYTENLVVPRDWGIAYRTVSQAAANGSKDAETTRKEMERRGFTTSPDTTTRATAKHPPAGKKGSPLDSLVSPVFIDFHADTSTNIPDTTLLKEALEGLGGNKEQAVASEVGARVNLDSTARSLIEIAAEGGVPEALCVMGRLAERGAECPKDPIHAAAQYLRAWRMESSRAPALLWKAMQTPDFGRELDARSLRGDPDAMYVWAGLTWTGFNRALSEAQAFNLLQRAAAAGHTPSKIELALCYFTGRWTAKDPARGIALWREASRVSREAQMRLAMAEVFGYHAVADTATAVAMLRTFADDGCLLAEVTVGYCFEKGVGVDRNWGEAYKIYHGAIRRGSETAFQSLRRMHDALRPPDPEFQLSN